MSETNPATSDGDSAAGESGVPAALRQFGHYELISVLGRGAQGVVYLAEDTQLHRKVALKMLEGINVLTPQVRERFQREAEVTSKLDHPHICAIHEFGELNGLMYMAMQHVRGTTLSELISQAQRARDDSGFQRSLDTESTTSLTGENSLQDVLRLIERSARALHVAHEAGLIHRDVKPGNIMVTPEGHPVLLDFGLARDVEDTGAALTETGQVLGTPAYMAPEQLRGIRDKIDRQTDVYALGVTLFESLTLQRPFQAESFEGLYNEILQGTPISPRKTNVRIPNDLITVIEVAMERDRGRRYASALEFADELRRVRSFEPIHARPAGPLTRLHKWARRRPAAAVALSAGVLFLAFALGLLGARELRQRSSEREHLRQAERLLDADDLAGAALSVAQARELRGDSMPAMNLDARISARRDQLDLETRRRTALAAAEAAREEARAIQEPHAALHARLQALEAGLARSRGAVFNAFAPTSLRADFAARERELTRLQLESESALQRALEALERAAREEAPWGREPATDEAFAAFYMDRWREALREGDDIRQQVLRSLIEQHDLLGTYGGELLGQGRLTLTCTPASAELFLFRHEPYESLRPDAVVPRVVPVPTSGSGRVHEREWLPGFHPGDPCLEITGVAARSAAHAAGLRPGDLVLRLAGQPVGEGLRLDPDRPDEELIAAGLAGPLRVATLNGEPVTSLLDWAGAAAAEGGGPDRLTLAGVDGEFECSQGLVAVVTARELIESRPAVGALELECLRAGEPLLISVTPGEHSGLRLRPTAYPLICSATNRVATGRVLDVDPGSYLVLAHSPGFEDQRFCVWIERGGSATVSIELLAAGSTPEEFVYVPPGPFPMGGDPNSQEPTATELITLAGFFIGRREVSNAQWNEFLADPETVQRMATAERPIYRPREQAGLIPAANLGGPDTPVMGISWNDARDYVAWRNRMAEEIGEPWVYDLPDEREWEKSARGVDARTFPWGDRFDFDLVVGLHSKRVNLFDVPGGFELRDESPYGVQDLGGMRTEWTRDPFVPDPSAPPMFRRRGGAWWSSREIDFRSASRFFGEAASSGGNTGLRLIARPRR